MLGSPSSLAVRERIGYLPEEKGLYKKMKVIDQLIFLGELHGLDAATAGLLKQRIGPGGIASDATTTPVVEAEMVAAEYLSAVARLLVQRHRLVLIASDAGPVLVGCPEVLAGRHHAAVTRLLVQVFCYKHSDHSVPTTLSQPLCPNHSVPTILSKS